jgi:bilin biosynthesis protein
MSQFSTRAIDPAQTDALLEVVTQQITLMTFDEEDEEMVGRLVSCLADPREGAQMALASTFGEIGEAATGILVEGLLGHPIALARRGCGRSLAKVRDPDSVPGLIQALLMDGDPRVKSAVASALVAIGEPAVVALLEVIASEAGMTETGHAAWALAHMDGEALPAFYGAIGSPVGAVRCAVVAATSAVVKAHGPSFLPGPAIDLIVSALTDLDPMVRSEAATAIGNIPLKVEVEKLLVTLADPVEEVRRAGAIALGRLGDRKAIEFLERAATGDESNSVRILAALAIGAILQGRGFANG